MKKPFITAVVLSLFCLITPSVDAKWGRHKKVEPQLPTLESFDSRSGRVQIYLDKKLAELNTDLVTYPGLKDQIEAVIADINTLTLMSISDPGYAERFDEMHASLLFLWKLEQYNNA